jgi:serine/threonine protein kinase
VATAVAMCHGQQDIATTTPGDQRDSMAQKRPCIIIVRALKEPFLGNALLSDAPITVLGVAEHADPTNRLSGNTHVCVSGSLDTLPSQHGTPYWLNWLAPDACMMVRIHHCCRLPLEDIVWYNTNAILSFLSVYPVLECACCHDTEGAVSMAYTIMPGQILTDYTNVAIRVERVAQGGMGLVAMGPNILNGSAFPVGTWFALKTILPDLLPHNKHLRDRFIREALTWQSIWSHPNVMLCYSVSEIAGVFFLLLGYADHGSLADRLRKNRRLAPAAALTVAQMVTAGLVHLHTPDPTINRPTPIVHYDLKPENILFRIDSRGDPLAMITDFGLASGQMGGTISSAETIDPTRSAMYRTRMGEIMGTPRYMAPEQWDGPEIVSTPADMYALGIILFEMLTGHYPYAVAQPHALSAWEEAHRRQTPQPLRKSLRNTPDVLDRLVASMLAKAPHDRPTAAATLVDLQQAAHLLKIEPYTFQIPAHTPQNELMYWNNLASSSAQLGYNAEALECIDRAIHLAPNEPTVLLIRGNILKAMQRYPEALTIFEQALAYCPESNQVLQAGILTMLGVNYNEWARISQPEEAQSRYTQAEEMYARCLALDPHRGDTWRARGINQMQWAAVLVKQTQWSQAKEHLDAATAAYHQLRQHNPNDANYNQGILTIQRLLMQVSPHLI